MGDFRITEAFHDQFTVAYATRVCPNQFNGAERVILRQALRAIFHRF
jgi:hypothetical protein